MPLEDSMNEQSIVSVPQIQVILNQCQNVLDILQVFLLQRSNANV